MSIQYRFVQPVDTVSIRGNKLFGDAGSFGDSSFPPRPSVLSGAFRSALLAGLAQEIGSFTENRALSDAGLAKILGTPVAPGDFTLSGVFPARRDTSNNVEIFLSLPADVVVSNEGATLCKLTPEKLPSEILTSQVAGLPFVPILRQAKQTKPEAGWMLNAKGVQAYMSGGLLDETCLLKQSELWIKESRVGIALSSGSRTAADGALFTTEYTTPVQIEHKAFGAGLAVGISGCGEYLPKTGWLRLGGDGRAARFSTMANPVMDVDSANLMQNKQFKLVLITPGLFAQGWLPDGIVQEKESYWLRLPGLVARLACVAVSRAEVISGWDLAQWCPKPAERVAPAGSVYWFDQVDGDSLVLDKLVTQGIWPETPDNSQKSRWAEGYNRVLVVAW